MSAPLSVALCVAHSPWVEARRVSMARLRDQLGVVESSRLASPCSVDATYREETERAPLSYWSESAWRWAVSTGADVCLFAQDDVEVAPDFWLRLVALCRAPWGILGAHSAHPACRALALAGYRWATTADGMIGTVYAVRRPVLEDFLAWRTRQLRPGAIDAITEDTLLGCYALASGNRVWHPIPAIHDHRVEVASTYANDAHPWRRPSVTWRDETIVPSLAAPTPPITAPHLGRFWTCTSWLLRRWCSSWTEEQHQAAERDQCPPAWSRGWIYY